MSTPAAKPPALRLHYPGYGEETLEIHLGDTRLCTATYDEHGSSGMRLASELARRMAQELGLPVVED